MITAVVIVYSVGWAFMSVFGFLAWAMGLGFNQDNMSTFFYEQSKLTVTVFCLIWFWPIAVPLGLLIQRRDNRRMDKDNQLYRAKLEAGENYGMLMILRNLPERLREDFEGTIVRVNRWNADTASGIGVKPVYHWHNGTQHEMIWKSEYLQEL